MLQYHQLWCIIQGPCERIGIFKWRKKFVCKILKKNAAQNFMENHLHFMNQISSVTQKHKNSFTYFQKTLINIITCRCFYWNYSQLCVKREQNVSSKRTWVLNSVCARRRSAFWVAFARAAPCAAFRQWKREREESIDLSGARRQECARWRELVMIGAPSVDPGR